ncbi:MAG: ABC transporter ATP-binding protein [Candidatus Marinamargulisbacteria bacterium]
MKKTQFMSDIQTILPYIKPYWRALLISIVCTAMFAISNVFIMPLVDDITREMGNKNFGGFTNHIINASLLFFIRLSSKYLQMYIMEKTSYQIMLSIRLSLYRTLHFMPSHAYTHQKHGDLTSRILDDCDKIRRAIFLNFESFLPNFLTIIGVVGYLIYLCWPLALLSLVGAPIFMVTLVYFSKRLRKVSRQLQQNTADLTQMIQESLINKSIIKIYTAEETNINRFDRLQKRYMTGYLKEIKFKITREQIDAYSQYIIFLIIIWAGGYLSLKGVIESSQLLSFFTGIVVLVEPVIIMTKIYAETFKITASIERINALFELDPPKAIPTTNHAIHFDTLTFNNVSFKYPNTSSFVLKDICFDAPKGAFIGIVGPSGAGKSTLVHLIAKYYTPTRGTITIDGYPMDTLSNQSLRQHIAYVPQESLLFKSTILDNCRMGRPEATIQDVINALKLAHAWDFVTALPDQLLTKIGTQGLTLSGGQRQRLSIARAIISRPSILILDEATSALDSDSEAKIQSAIQSLKGTFTIIVIAHRLSTIKDASNILVIDNGEIKETGTHNTLCKANGLYYSFIQKQGLIKS